MKPGIRKLTRIVFGAYLGLALGSASWTLVLTNRRVEADRLQETALKWESRVLRLMVLTYEVTRFPSERVFSQWRDNYHRLHDQFDDYLSSASDHRQLAGIQQSLEALPGLIDHVASPDVSSGAKDQYALNIQSRMQSMILTSRSIAEDMMQRSSDVEESILRVLFVVLLGYLVLTGVLFLVLNRWIVRPVKHLVDDIVRLGEGDLNSPIRSAAGEELASIANAAEQTRRSLAEVMVSRNALAKEVEERERVETQLREQQDRNQTYLDTAEVLILVLDEEARITEINAAGCRMLGRTRESLLGENWFEVALPQPEGMEQVYPVFHRVMRGETENMTRHENDVLSEEGQRLRIAWSSVVLRDDNGKAVGMLSVGRDVTEVREAEKERAQYWKNLEKEVRVRTAQLSRRTRDLETANRDLEGFSYSVSHDLRSPLRAIDGFIAILEEDYASQLDEEGLRLLKVVSNNARKMGGLIDDILAFSRAGRLEIMHETIDMNALVDSVWNDLEAERRDSGCRFERGELAVASGDVRALRHVWQNLLSNAIKFSRERKPAAIEVTSEQENGEIRYTVRDNGVGFNPEFANKLFVLFQRLHGMEEYEGTGVGLAIVKRFVQKHGGVVEAHGVLDEGAAFSFTLPEQELDETGTH